MIRRLALLLALLASLPLCAEETQRYMVTLRSRPDVTPAMPHVRVLERDEAARHGVRMFRHVDAFAATLTAAEAAELHRSADVEGVAPVVERTAQEVVSPTDLPQGELASSWGVVAVHAPDVWPITRGENVNVAVLDTGIELEHPDLREAIAGGTNVLDPTKSPQDDNKHGTHVAGIVGARANGFGVVGVAPAVKLWAVKVLDAQGKGSD